MFFQFLIAVIAGIFSGIITGLTPGLHVNIVVLVVISYLKVHPLVVSVYIFSLGITHTFVDAVPAVFLGAPDEDMSLLPGHDLFVKGAGYEAVKLTVIGSFFTMLLGVFFIPLLFFSLPLVYSFLRPFIGYLLIFLVCVLFYKSFKFYSFFVFFSSGILGFFVLNSHVEHKFLSLFTGLFAVSTIFSSLLFPPRIVPQQITNIIRFSKKELLRTVFGSGIAGLFTSIFPGLSPSQGTALVQPFFNKSKFSYLVFIGGVNTIDFFISLSTLYLIGKARNGAVIGIDEVLFFVNFEQLLALSLVGLLSGCLSVFLTLRIARLMVVFVNKFNFRKISLTVLLFLFFLVFYFTGFTGLLIMLTSSIIGLIPVFSKTPRSFCMGCLLIPVIISL